MLGFVWAALLCADTGSGGGEACALRWRPQASLYSQRLTAMCRALPAGGRSTCNSTLISVDRLVRLQITVDRAPYDVSFCVANGSASATEAQARRFAAEACQKLQLPLTSRSDRLEMGSSCGGLPQDTIHHNA